MNDDDRASSSPPATTGATGARDGRVAAYLCVCYLTPFLVIGALAWSDIRAPNVSLVGLATAQLAATFITHLFAIRGGQMLDAAAGAGLVGQVASIGLLVWATGGAGGPLVFLFTLHALAAGILLSSAAGVRSLLLSTAALVAIETFGTETVPPPGLPPGVGAIVALWLLGGGATLFSVLNERELRRRNTELATIREVTLGIENSLSVTEVCSALCRGVSAGFRFSSVAVLQREGETLRCVGAHGVTGMRSAVIPLAGRLAEALDGTGPVVVPRGDAQREPALGDLIGPRGYVAVPMGDVLLIATRSGRRRRGARVATHEVDALERLAHHARLAIANARLHEQVAEMARTDGLTGIANRREFQRFLDAEMTKLQRYATLRAAGAFPSVMIIDIDHFKAVNDRFGHQAGDAALRVVADTLRTTVRQYDMVGRYGGEEFAVLLPNTDAEAARATAQRIRRSIAQAVVHAPDGRRIRLAVSIGIATAPDNGDTDAGLLASADAALYRAKEEGRNRAFHALDGGHEDARVFKMDVRRRRQASAAGPARGGSRRAPGRSSLPKPRTPPV